MVFSFPFLGNCVNMPNRPRQLFQSHWSVHPPELYHRRRKRLWSIRTEEQIKYHEFHKSISRKRTFTNSSYAKWSSFTFVSSCINCSNVLQGNWFGGKRKVASGKDRLGRFCRCLVIAISSAPNCCSVVFIPSKLRRTSVLNSENNKYVLRTLNLQIYMWD